MISRMAQLVLAATFLGATFAAVNVASASAAEHIGATQAVSRVTGMGPTLKDANKRPPTFPDIRSSASGETLLRTGEKLLPGQYLITTNGLGVTYKLVMQGDGNLVLYKQTGCSTTPIWWSNHGQYARQSVYAVMQSGGNLVLYNASGRAVWWSDFGGHSGNTFARLQTDGNFVIYETVRGNLEPVWTSNSLQANRTTLTPGSTLRPGEYLITQNGEMTSFLIMQCDGNLVLYQRSYLQGFTAVWWTNHGQYARQSVYAVMQTGGNLVLYNASGQAVWWSDFGNHNGAWAQLQADGNFVIYQKILGVTVPLHWTGTGYPQSPAPQSATAAM